MPTFGQHETGQRIHLSGVGAIYLLKNNPQKIVKVVQPPEGIWSDEQMREEIEAFLAHAKTQKSVARASKAIAPIDEVATLRHGTEGSSGGGEAATQAEGAGYTASGAYLVMDRYERSAKSLIEGRVKLNNNDLRNLLSGVLRGLRDIRQIGSRPHGNLKPSNILLANSSDLAQATVHLTDPAAPGSITAKSDNEDFTDLAKILYELVSLRPYQGGTVPRTKDWNDLGPNGEDWRKFCNTMLDVGTGGGTADDKNFDKLLAAIDTWRAKPKRSKLPVIAAGFLLLLIAGGVAAYIFTRPPKLDFDQAKWEKLCLQYQAWFDNVASMDDATKKKFSSPPYPTDVVRLLDSAGRELNKYQPQTIAKRPQSFTNLAVNPTDDAKTGYGPYYTKQGDELIDKVADALTPAHWQVLTQLDKTAKTYEERGWNRPAAGIRSLIDSAKPPPLPAGTLDIETRAKQTPHVDIFANIDNTIKASNSVLEIEKRWVSIQDQIKNIPATDVPLLKALPKFAEDSARSDPAPASSSAPGTLADVQALSISFSEIEKVVSQLFTELNRKDQTIVYAELAKDPDAQLPPDGKITAAMYAHLLELAKGYVKLQQDPRTSIAWSASLDEIQKNFIDRIKEANPQDANLPDLIKRKAAVEDTVAAFTRLPPIQLQRTRIRTLVSNATEDLTKLKTDGETWVAPYIIDPQQYIAQQHARITSTPLAKATPVVYNEWQKAHNALLKKVEAAPLELKKYRTFQAIDAKFAALQNIYADFDLKMIPAKVPGLSDFPARENWQSAIAAKVATIYREQALTDLMTNPALKWSDDLPQIADPAYQSYAKDRIAAYEQTRKDTLALIDDYTTIQTRLDHLDLLPGEPAKDAKSWRDLSAKWTSSKNPLLADSEIAAALKPIADRASALAALDNIKDYKQLIAGTLSAAPEIALTAWRKLGETPLAESLPVLDDEDKAQSNLTTEFATLTKAGKLDATRSAALSNELKAQRPIRWRRYAGTLSSPAAIEKALDARNTFAVSLSVQSEPNLVYDELVYNLRKDFDKNPKEAELKEIAKKFLADLQTLPASISKDKATLDLVARIEKPLAPGAGEVSTAGAGPKLAGWEQDSPNPDLRVFYFPSKAAPRQTLEFTRIQAGQKTVFLCTTEVSAGLFLHVAASPQAASDLDNTGKPAALAHWFKPSGDPWDGPRVWKLTAGKFALNDDWLFKSPQLGDTSPYPAGAAPEKPAPAFPMQQITPWAAMYVARALGCRLPTFEEWKAAYDKFETAGPKDAWNLRGAGWLTQQQYAGKLAAKGAQYPDQGIFLSADQLFAGITADAATPWQSKDLAKLAPNRIMTGGVYPTSQIWFRKVGSQPGVTSAGVPHDLVGNVAEYVFDAPAANAVIKDNAAKVDAVNAALPDKSKFLFVIGGSSLSPPQIPVTEKQPVDPEFAQTLVGFSDVGFRLAYTAPIDSIADVLSAVFRAPPYLPGGPAK